MRKQEYRNLIKNKNKKELQKIIYKHINDEIYLSSKQIDEILKKRGDYNARDFKEITQQEFEQMKNNFGYDEDKEEQE